MKYFKCVQILSTVVVGHKMFFQIIADVNLQKKYKSYWFRKSRWSPIGVIESFMKYEFQLFCNMEDFVWVLSKIGLLRFTQSDTERVNKTVDKIERRFASFNEVKEAEGKRDRTKEEVFLHENKIALDELPLEDINKLWLKKHRSALKKESKKDVSLQRFMEKDSSKQKFWTN